MGVVVVSLVPAFAGLSASFLDDGLKSFEMNCREDRER